MIGDSATERHFVAESLPERAEGERLSQFEYAVRNRARWGWIKSITPLIWASLFVVAAFVLAGIFANVLAPHDPLRNDLMGRLKPPAFTGDDSSKFILGSDQLGRDVLSRIIYGARVSLAIATLGTLFGAAIGACCGIVSGYLRGRVDEAMMLLTDAFIALPFLIIALSVVSIFGSSMRVLIFLAAFSGWASYTRVMRGLALNTREEQYVLAAKAIGAGPIRLLFRHVLPNIFAPLIVLTTFELTSIILLEASLSFLGFGIQPPTPAWGLMVSEGREYLNTAWWVGVFPGAAIMLVAMSVSLTGDWLRDVLDPKLRSR
jgi:peptide/nickel transport system permease protein